jgi:hypothetical protein
MIKYEMALCRPAMVYLALSIVFLLLQMYTSMKAIAIVLRVIFIAIWTWILNYLCSKNMFEVSWSLVVILFVFMLLRLFKIGKR